MELKNVEYLCECFTDTRKCVEEPQKCPIARWSSWPFAAVGWRGVLLLARGFPRVCSDDFCEADCSSGSCNEPTLPYTWHVLLFTHPVPENMRHRCALSANRVLLPYVFKGWETKLVWYASLCLSWVEGYKLRREGNSWMAYRYMTSVVPQSGGVHNLSIFLERREVRITVCFLSWLQRSCHIF